MGATNTTLESLLTQRLEYAGSEGCPPQLAAAMQWAVFPGGARIRPRLCLAVAMACGATAELAVIPAAALELLHCASLVHDDMPCFDNAELRRGRASVHCQFGERLALLSGDALIVMAFELLAEELKNTPALLVKLMPVIARGVSTPAGVVAGQAWECEPRVELKAYHQAKTGALFAAATEAGATAAGFPESTQWAALGARLGEAYQVADDILDAAGSVKDVGKPVGQDKRNTCPNSAAQHGLCASIQQLRKLVDQAIESIPHCPGQVALSTQIRAETDRMLPPRIAALAA